MLELIGRFGNFVDSLTGVPGTLGYLVVTIVVILGYSWTSASMFPADQLIDSKHPSAKSSSAGEKATEELDPPRNFTKQQLAHFDGSQDPKSGENKPVYLSVNGIVFDVTKGRDFYGPGGPYEKFAGHECGVALAKMSFDEQHLDDLKGCKELNFGEKTELEGWIDKFQHYRCYPVVGRLVMDLPDSERILTKLDLEENNGSGKIPEGYAAAPIYIGANGLVFDMSFGGVTFYGPGGPYNKFAGKDASRALALMSLDDADLENPSIADCTEKQLKTMNDWIATFRNRKGYPIVGRLEKS